MRNTTEIDSVISANLRHLVAAIGIKQVDLAKMSGVDQQTISRVMLGKQHAGPETVEKLAKALGTSAIKMYQENPAIVMRDGFAEACMALNLYARATPERRAAAVDALKSDWVDNAPPGISSLLVKFDGKSWQAIEHLLKRGQKTEKKASTSAG